MRKGRTPSLGGFSTERRRIYSAQHKQDIRPERGEETFLALGGVVLFAAVSTIVGKTGSFELGRSFSEKRGGLERDGVLLVSLSLTLLFWNKKNFHEFKIELSVVGVCSVQSEEKRVKAVKKSVLKAPLPFCSHGRRQTESKEWGRADVSEQEMEELSPCRAFFQYRSGDERRLD